MHNHLGIQINQKCKVGSTIIDVDSTKYNEDPNYSKQINQALINSLKWKIQ